MLPSERLHQHRAEVLEVVSIALTILDFLGWRSYIKREPGPCVNRNRAGAAHERLARLSIRLQGFSAPTSGLLVGVNCYSACEAKSRTIASAAKITAKAACARIGNPSFPFAPRQAHGQL